MPPTDTRLPSSPVAGALRTGGVAVPLGLIFTYVVGQFLAGYQLPPDIKGAVDTLALMFATGLVSGAGKFLRDKGLAVGAIL